MEEDRQFEETRDEINKAHKAEHEKIKLAREGMATCRKKRVIYADSIVSSSTLDEPLIRSKRRGISCNCFRRKQNKEVVPDYVVSPPQSRRTLYSIQFIHSTYDRLLKDTHRITYDWAQAGVHCEIIDAFKHCRRGLRFLQLLNKFAEESIQSMSYYLEDNMPEKQVELTDCRSIIGSFTWLIVLYFQSNAQPQSVVEATDFRRILKDIVHLSMKNWVGIVRTVEFFIKVRIKTESTIDKYLLPLDIEPQSKESKDTFGKNQPLGEVRKEKLRKLKLYNSVGHHSLGLDAKYSSNFDKLRVFTKPESQDPNDANDWIKTEDEPLEDNREEIINLCKYIKEILRDAHLNIHFIEKYMSQFQDENAIESATSYSEAMLLLRRTLKTLSKQECDQKHLILNDENRLAMVEMGKILEDNLELTEYFLMSLRTLVYESRHVVHVVYEFCRLYLNCEIPRYDIAASVDRRKLLEKFKSIDYKTKVDTTLPNAEEVPLTRESTMKEIKCSPYIQLLQVIPLHANGCYYKVQPDPILVSG